MKLKRKPQVTNRTELVALANRIIDRNGLSQKRLKPGNWQRAAAIVRHNHPELAEQVRTVCKHRTTS